MKVSGISNSKQIIKSSLLDKNEKMKENKR